jgi:hypothetical protein
MRTKRYQVVVLAVLVVALGIAVSLVTVPAIAQTFSPAMTPMSAAASAAPLVFHVRNIASASVPQQGFDAAGLLMVGSALFGLAAVVRKRKTV